MQRGEDTGGIYDDSQLLPYGRSLSSGIRVTDEVASDAAWQPRGQRL